MVRIGRDTSRDGAALGFNHSAGYDYDENQIPVFLHQRMPGIGVSDGHSVGQGSWGVRACVSEAQSAGVIFQFRRAIRIETNGLSRLKKQKGK